MTRWLAVLSLVLMPLPVAALEEHPALETARALLASIQNKP